MTSADRCQVASDRYQPVQMPRVTAHRYASRANRHNRTDLTVIFAALEALSIRIFLR